MLGFNFCCKESFFCNRLREPIELGSTDFGDIAINCDQVMGFPSNDGKMQNILGGDISNAGIVPCTKCISQRRFFGRWTDRLLGLRQPAIQYVAAEKPKLRVGEMSTEACAARYEENLIGNHQILTADQKREQTIACANCFKPPLLNTHPKKLTNDPLHISSGIANKGPDEMRVQIRELEENNVFLENAKRAEVKISKVLQQLSLTPQITHVEKDIDIDDEELTLEDLAVYEAPIEPLLLPVHKESLALRRAINKLTAKVAELEALRVKTADLQEDEDLTLTELVELEKEVFALDEDFAESVTKMNELWINCRKHNIESKYGHYVQLLVGLSELYKALTKLLASNSKRPRGKIEFIFNNAIEFVGGGEYMAEHSGYEQTNGRALNTLKNFADVKALCLSAIDSSDAMFPKAQAMFELFDNLGVHTYALLVHLKSQ